MIELNSKTGKVLLVRGLHLSDKLLLGPALLSGTDHDRRAVCVVGTYKDALAPSELLESDPNVCLDVLDKVPNVDVAVCIRQCGRHENLFVVDVFIAHGGLVYSLGVFRVVQCTHVPDARAPTQCPGASVLFHGILGLGLDKSPVHAVPCERFGFQVQYPSTINGQELCGSTSRKPSLPPLLPPYIIQQNSP